MIWRLSRKFDKNAFYPSKLRLNVMGGMRKKTVALTSVSTLLVLALAGAILLNMATADAVTPEPLSKITINSDGSVTPETDYINRAGNSYTLTSDIIDEYLIEILRSNIVFDGGGHIINVTKTYASPLDLIEVTNVTIRNVEVYSRYISIDLRLCSNCLVTNVKTGENVRIIGTSNTLTKSNVMVSMWEGNNNLIIRNNITGIFIGSNFNIFSQNNILFDLLPGVFSSWIEHTNFWDNGSVGNYWLDYSTKFPNASEISNSGIGDKTYEIDAKNIDHHPLMNPFDIENGTIALPPREPQPEPFPTTIIASVVTVAVVGIGLLFYFKKRKH